MSTVEFLSIELPCAIDSGGGLLLGEDPAVRKPEATGPIGRAEATATAITCLVVEVIVVILAVVIFVLL